jgi:hypothetical protein
VAETPAATETPALNALRRREINVSQQFVTAVTGALDLALPPAEPEGPRAPAEELIDIPNNAEIIRLPQMTVVGERPPVFRETDLYSREELQKLALQRFRGLNLFPIAFLNNLNRPIAEQIYRQEERLSNISNLNQAAFNAAAAGDREGAEFIRRETIRTYKYDAPAWQNRMRDSVTPR